MQVNDHERIWIVEKYAERLIQLISSEPGPYSGGVWESRLFAISQAALRIHEITRADEDT